MKNWVCDGLVSVLGTAGGRSTLCWGLSDLALRLLRWPRLSGMMGLASRSVDDTAQVRVACFGYMEHATSSWTKSPT